MSFGFIAHFSDPELVVDRHLAWLKPGGRLVPGVPNFNGTYRPIQCILDRTILEKHNFEIMKLGWFRQFAERKALKLDHLAFNGSFEPWLPIPNPGYGNPLQFVTKCLLRAGTAIRRSPLLDRLNHPAISGYILAIFRKDDGA